MKLFNFQSLTLDAALRKFLKQFQLVGDAQEKERVLLYFAKRYVDANNIAFTDVGKCEITYKRNNNNIFKASILSNR